MAEVVPMLRAVAFLSVALLPGSEVGAVTVCL